MQYVDVWRGVAAATGRADRDAAEDGVRLAYRSAGLDEPERIIWADSPRAAVEAVEKLSGAGRSVREEVRTRPWAEERRRMYDELGPAGWSALWSATGAQLWETTAALAERIRTGVVTELVSRPEDESDIRLVLLDAVLGQHDAAWLAAFDGRGDRLTGLAEVARNAGWWWPYEHAVVISDRPEVLHRDEAGRLDRGDGPAVAYPDGFALYAWRGMPVPAAFLDGLASLTADRIRAEENAELRRVMLEYYGYDRYLTESGAEPVHRDGAGILWRITMEGDEDVVMVEVVNSTPEPDGTHRTYWLRVPPRTRTAKEGVAWTFGLEGEDYAPVRQT
ncbi:MAG TPA: hypothetical protein VN520_26690 [Streptomyces sp.]|uniref:DUF6745 domain-containing protein n=1 Tax=Streptomyces sp. TaxID=1931 RepID=UPI002C631AF3|nr:hypothetical protein [Streptomyces sp.]HWU09918.1 hypothetical protein [Streptomyces sp.]